MSIRRELEERIRADIEARHGIFIPSAEADLLLTREVQEDMERLLEEDDRDDF